MRGILVDESVKVYSEPGNQSLSLTMLKKGDEFELNKVSKKNREVWVEVVLSSGQSGYIPGETKIFAIKKVQLKSDQAELREGPNAESRLIKTYPRKAVVTAIGYEKDDSRGWFKVKDDDGLVGYMKSDNKFQIFQESTKADGKKQMLTGGMCIFLGAAFMIYSFTQDQAANDMSFIIIIVFAFGLLQLVQGYLQYNKAKKIENDKK